MKFSTSNIIMLYSNYKVIICLSLKLYIYIVSFLSVKYSKQPSYLPICFGIQLYYHTITTTIDFKNIVFSGENVTVIFN